MDEAERIRSMQREGRLTPAEAERLLHALGELRREQEADQDTDADEAPGRDPEGAASASFASTGPAAAAAFGGRPNAAEGSVPPRIDDMGGEAYGEPHAEAASTTAADSAAAGVRRWLLVDAFATQLRVESDASLEVPEARADGEAITVERTEEGFRVRQTAEAAAGGLDGWIDRLVSGFKNRTLEVKVPADCGLHLSARAGDVRLQDVVAVRGRLTAGDVDARGLRQVDLSMQAGDVDLELDPLPGHHALRLSVGDVNVRLPKSADVRVRASVRVGDIEGDPPFGAASPDRGRRGGLGGSLDGTLGEGRAELELSVVTGDLDVKVV